MVRTRHWVSRSEIPHHHQQCFTGSLYLFWVTFAYKDILFFFSFLDILLLLYFKTTNKAVVITCFLIYWCASVWCCLAWRRSVPLLFNGPGDGRQSHRQQHSRGLHPRPAPLFIYPDVASAFNLYTCKKTIKLMSVSVWYMKNRRMEEVSMWMGRPPWDFEHQWSLTTKLKWVRPSLLSILFTVSLWSRVCT